MKDWSVVQWLSHVHLTCNMLPLEHDCWSVCKTLPLDFECCRGCKMLPLDLDWCKVWWDACMWFKSLLFNVPGTLAADLNKKLLLELMFGVCLTFTGKNVFTRRILYEMERVICHSNYESFRADTWLLNIQVEVSSLLHRLT